MTHEMKLNNNAFNKIKEGIKKFELRLYDEKRKEINIGDLITFHNLNDLNNTITVQVVGLLRYKSFSELFEDIDYNLCGPARNLEEKLNRLHSFYSEEQELHYGVLAIKIKLI